MCLIQTVSSYDAIAPEAVRLLQPATRGINETYPVLCNAARRLQMGTAERQRLVDRLGGLTGFNRR